MNDLTHEAIGKVVAAWASVSAPWKAEAEARDDVSEMCILATGACAAVLQAEFGLEVSVLAVDLYALTDESGEFEPLVEHPDGSTAIQDGGYLGHVVAVVKEEGQSYIVDAELGIIARFNDQVAQGEVDGQQYMYRARGEHREFSETDAWVKRDGAAAQVSVALGTDPP